MPWPSYGARAALIVVGVFAFAVAGLSIVDMYLAHPYDGVVLEADAPGRIEVRAVVPGSGADRAGIRPGDQIVGIARAALRSPGHAATLLSLHAIGSRVPYLVRTHGRLRELTIEMGQRRIGDTSYMYVAFLGFCFFLIGLFVLAQQPRLVASQVFFILCSLFLLFLVCRLRPASYSWVDRFVLGTGTGALVLLPASFLHFFLIFPRPLWDGQLRGGVLARFISFARGRGLALLYAIPALVFAATAAWGLVRHGEVHVISGAPAANWWVLAVYMLLGLAALALNSRHLRMASERRGAKLVFWGSLCGLLPFLILAVGFPSFLGTERFLFFGLLPLILVPLIFAYAIIRFQLLDIRLILRKSLLYTTTTAVVTATYAVLIFSFNRLFQGTPLASAAYFPAILALAIVFLLDPLRRRVQVWIDRFFFAHRARLQAAMIEMGEALRGQPGQLDPALVAQDLVGRLPQLLGLRFAALYLLRGDHLERAAGPDSLPSSLPPLEALPGDAASLARCEQVASGQHTSAETRQTLQLLLQHGVEAIGELASPRRRLGIVLLAGRTGLPLEEDELRLLRGLLNQAAIALETSLLLEERAKQLELERDLTIAAAIQASLLPRSVRLGHGWEVAAVCRPARHIGGDFYAELPGPNGNGPALVYGDVSGKSVPGALMMMAAKETLHSLALAHRDPEHVLGLANQRLYDLQERGFVALGYLAPGSDGTTLQYALAGQPAPLKRSHRGTVGALPLPDHRLPLGAMRGGTHRMSVTPMDPGEIILAYSDGVIEAQSKSGEFFGEERLVGVLSRATARPSDILTEVLDAIELFTGGAEPYDDLTLLVIGRPPLENAS